MLWSVLEVMFKQMIQKIDSVRCLRRRHKHTKMIKKSELKKNWMSREKENIVIDYELLSSFVLISCSAEQKTHRRSFDSFELNIPGAWMRCVLQQCCSMWQNKWSSPIENSNPKSQSFFISNHRIESMPRNKWPALCDVPKCFFLEWIDASIDKLRVE